MDHAAAAVIGPVAAVDPIPAVSVAVAVEEPPVEGLVFKVPVCDQLRQYGITAFGADVGDDAVFRYRLESAVLGLCFFAATAGIGMRTVVVGNRLAPVMPERGHIEHVA